MEIGIVAAGGTKAVAVRVRAKPGCEPFYATDGSAGADLRAAIESSRRLSPGEREAIPTGVHLELPVHYEAQVRPRSGLALRYGLTVLNSPGTIDSDYRGEIMVPLVNHGGETVTIEPGMRIAQLIIAPIVRADFTVVHSLSDTDRAEGGFGSTGEQ